MSYQPQQFVMNPNPEIQSESSYQSQTQPFEERYTYINPSYMDTYKLNGNLKKHHDTKSTHGVWNNLMEKTFDNSTKIRQHQPDTSRTIIPDRNQEVQNNRTSKNFQNSNKSNLDNQQEEKIYRPRQKNQETQQTNPIYHKHITNEQFKESFQPQQVNSNHHKHITNTLFKESSLSQKNNPIFHKDISNKLFKETTEYKNNIQSLSKPQTLGYSKIHRSSLFKNNQ